MRSIKSIISALKKDDNVIVTEKATIRYASCNDLNEEGRGWVACHMIGDFRNPVKVDQWLIDDADAKAKTAEDAATVAEKEAKKAGATDEVKDAATKAREQATELRKYADSLELDEYVRGESDTIFLRVATIISMLLDNPETVFLAGYLQDLLKSKDAELIEMAAGYIRDILTGATFTDVAIDVAEHEMYRSPFRDRGDFEKVTNDSVYHEACQLVIDQIGWDTADEIRSLQRELRLAKMRNAQKRKAQGRVRRATDDIDDSQD